MRTKSLIRAVAALLPPVLVLASACGGEGPHAGPDEPPKDSASGYAAEADVAEKIPATDSAAAGTAMATGRKTEAGNVCWQEGDPPGGELENLGELFDAEGWAVGVVSTVPFDHATPACFVAHSPDRNHYYRGYEGRDGDGIAEEMIGEGLADLIVGAGHPAWENPDWSTSEGHISRPLYEALAGGETRYVLVERTSGADGAALLAGAAAGLDPDGDGGVFGLFGGPEGCFEPPVPAAGGSVSPATGENPTLSEAAVVALDYLSRDDDGFFLMLEQGDIDWANHNNNYHWMLGAMWDLETAVRTVTGYVDTSSALDPENTLILVTSDHSNGYMRLAMNNPLGEGELPAMEGEDPDHTYPNGQVTWGCTEHTNELVTVAAAGPERALRRLRGLESTPPAPEAGRIIDNTHLHAVMAACPELDPEVSHVILIIGDGMSPEHERAAGIYLHGSASGMAWQDTTAFPYQGLCTTWDVDTYNRYARKAGAPRFSPDGFDPDLGYDPSRGGTEPLEGEESYFLTPLPAYPPEGT
jgi:alkaline phosphatase